MKTENRDYITGNIMSSCVLLLFRATVVNTETFPLVFIYHDDGLASVNQLSEQTMRSKQRTRTFGSRRRHA